MVSNDVDMLFSNIDRECNIIDAAAPKKRGAVDLVGLAEREDLIQVGNRIAAVQVHQAALVELRDERRVMPADRARESVERPRLVAFDVDLHQIEPRQILMRRRD